MTVSAREKIESDCLRAETYLIGEEVATDDFKLLCHASMPLRFCEEDEYTCRMHMETESRKYMEYNYQMRGCLYLGYVVIILDRDDHPVECKSDLSWITEDRLDALRQFDDGDFFNDQLEPRPVPRPNYSKYRVGVQ